MNTTRLLRTLLLGVTEHDPLVFAANAALLVAVAALACALPALKAARHRSDAGAADRLIRCYEPAI